MDPDAKPSDLLCHGVLVCLFMLPPLGPSCVSDLPWFVRTVKRVGHVERLVPPVYSKRHGFILAESGTRPDAVAPYGAVSALVPTSPRFRPLGDALIERRSTGGSQTDRYGGDAKFFTWVGTIVSHIDQPVLETACRWRCSISTYPRAVRPGRKDGHGSQNQGRYTVSHDARLLVRSVVKVRAEPEEEDRGIQAQGFYVETPAEPQWS